MRNIKIEYKRSNGSLDFEIVRCKSIKLNNVIKNYYNNIDADILNVTEL